jgi:glutamate dehydrogenase (NAD(P)+)
MVELNPFRTAQGLFDNAAERLGLDPEARRILRWPMREQRVTVPVRMNDGNFRIFQAHRVQYNHALGPTIGGFRWHPDTDVDASRAHAAWTTWQAAVMGLPHGGACGGVDCNPKELSTGEKELLARRAARALSGLGRLDEDVITPDTYTTPQVMGWMMDTFHQTHGSRHETSTVGKPAILGGSPGLADATARGGVIAVREAATELGLDPSALRFAVHGFGNIGRAVAARHVELLGGGTLVGVSDSHGSAIAPEGIDPDEARTHKLQTGSVGDIEEMETADADAIFELEVDVLYTAATADLITKDIAGRIRAKMLCELGDNPTTAEADDLLTSNGCLVIPDMLGSGGRLTIGHLEGVQMRSGDRWSSSALHGRLEEKMVDAFTSVRELARDEGVGMRLGAWMLGISRVAEACRARGWC